MVTKNKLWTWFKFFFIFYGGSLEVAEASVGPHAGLAVILVAGILAYMIFLLVSAIFAFIGLIFAISRFFRKKKSYLGLVLSILFLIPNLIGLGLYLYVLCYPEGPKPEDIPVLKDMGIVFGMVLFWFLFAFLANRRAKKKEQSQGD